MAKRKQSKRKQSTPLAVSKDGGLYVEVRAIMSPLIPLIDGLAVTFFGKGKTAYLKVDDAIRWCEKERLHHSRQKYDDIIAALVKFKEQEAGKPTP